MSVTIQLVTEKGLESGVIRGFTWSSISHVDIVVPGTNGGELLLGARVRPDKSFSGKAGVAVRPPNYAKFTTVIRATTDLDFGQSQKFWQAATSQIGKPYDWRAIVNFGMHRNWRDTGSWICSEYVAWCFEQSGKPVLNPEVPVNRITPRDLLLSTQFTLSQIGAEQTV